MIRRGWRIVAGYGLAVLAIYYVSRHAGITGPDFFRAFAALKPYSILLALFAFSIHIALNAFAFSLLSQGLSARLPLSTLASAWAGSLIAKYVPGGIWHVVGRGLLLSKLGLSARLTVITGIVEQAISLTVCALVALAAFLVLEGRVGGAAVVAIVGLGGATLVGVRLIPAIGPQIHRFRFLAAVAMYVFAMVPYLFGYLILVRPDQTIAFVYALFAGTVAGLMALVVPGGLGVREASAVLLYASDDSDRVMAAMVAARFLLLTCDVFGTVAGQQALRRVAPPQ